ncbi:hypothetical protein LXL04_029063 [Taraxacum kok-saghyz]
MASGLPDPPLKMHLKVKGIFVTNPSNPLGTSLTNHELDRLFNFISTKNIHLISDEVYSGTVFSSPNFISVMEVLKNKNLINTEVSKRVHIIYSLSKDLGLLGFRVGAIYSGNDDVVAAATKMSSFGLISSQTQYLLWEMLSDRKFTKLYLSENSRRLNTPARNARKGASEGRNPVPERERQFVLLGGYETSFDLTDFSRRTGAMGEDCVRCPVEHLAPFILS